MGIKICWLWPMGISQWPFQGRDKRVGFWLLCAYFLKIISSKHWCCGVLAPPPCQLSNCTSDWDLGRRDSYSPGCSLFPLRTSSLHHIPHGSPPPPHLPASPCSHAPFSRRCPGTILFKGTPQTPHRTPSLLSPTASVIDMAYM